MELTVTVDIAIEFGRWKSLIPRANKGSEPSHSGWPRWNLQIVIDLFRISRPMMQIFQSRIPSKLSLPFRTRQSHSLQLATVCTSTVEMQHPESTTHSYACLCFEIT